MSAKRITLHLPNGSRFGINGQYETVRDMIDYLAANRDATLDMFAERYNLAYNTASRHYKNFRNGAQLKPYIVQTECSAQQTTLINIESKIDVPAAIKGMRMLDVTGDPETIRSVMEATMPTMIAGKQYRNILVEV